MTVLSAILGYVRRFDFKGFLEEFRGFFLRVEFCGVLLRVDLVCHLIGFV